MPVDLLPETIRVDAGAFVMGNQAGNDDERPVHRVHLDAFYISKHPVTVGQYARFVRETGHRAPAVFELPLIVTSGGRDREKVFRSVATPYCWIDGQPPAAMQEHPATLVRWEDAAAFCAWMGGITGHAVRLPTEAEWERAARGGVDGRQFPWGDDIDPTRANYLADPTRRAAAGTTPVTKFQPNAFGLHDTIGNVWEWVSDWYQPEYYLSGPERNPRGAAQGQLRLVRGGAWTTSDPHMLTCSYRHKVPPDTYSYSIGFRVAFSEP